MEQDGEVFGPQPGAGEHRVDARHHTPLRRFLGGQDLGREQALPRLHHHVGEGAADVHREARAGAAHVQPSHMVPGLLPPAGPQPARDAGPLQVLLRQPGGARGN